MLVKTILKQGSNQISLPDSWETEYLRKPCINGTWTGEWLFRMKAQNRTLARKLIEFYLRDFLTPVQRPENRADDLWIRACAYRYVCSTLQYLKDNKIDKFPVRENGQEISSVFSSTFVSVHSVYYSNLNIVSLVVHSSPTYGVDSTPKSWYSITELFRERSSLFRLLLNYYHNNSFKIPLLDTSRVVDYVESEIPWELEEDEIAFIKESTSERGEAI